MAEAQQAIAGQPTTADRHQRTSALLGRATVGPRSLRPRRSPPRTVRASLAEPSVPLAKHARAAVEFAAPPGTPAAVLAALRRSLLFGEPALGLVCALGGGACSLGGSAGRGFDALAGPDHAGKSVGQAAAHYRPLLAAEGLRLRP